MVKIHFLDMVLLLYYKLTNVKQNIEIYLNLSHSHSWLQQTKLTQECVCWGGGLSWAIDVHLKIHLVYNFERKDLYLVKNRNLISCRHKNQSTNTEIRTVTKSWPLVTWPSQVIGHRKIINVTSDYRLVSN